MPFFEAADTLTGSTESRLLTDLLNSFTRILGTVRRGEFPLKNIDHISKANFLLIYTDMLNSYEVFNRKNRLGCYSYIMSYIAHMSTMAEGLCNYVAWITDHRPKTNYNEPCDNAFQPTLDLFLLKQRGHFLLLEG